MIKLLYCACERLRKKMYASTHLWSTKYITTYNINIQKITYGLNLNF